MVISAGEILAKNGRSTLRAMKNLQILLLVCVGATARAWGAEPAKLERVKLGTPSPRSGRQNKAWGASPRKAKTKRR